MYTITLSDGTKLDGLGLNGTNYVSSTEITEDMFTDKLAEISISDGTETTIYRDMELLYIQKQGDEWWFNFGKITKEEQMEKTITELQTALASMYEQMLGGV